MARGECLVCEGLALRVEQANAGTRRLAEADFEEHLYNEHGWLIAIQHTGRADG